MIIKTIGSYFGISKKKEVFILSIISVCYNIFDMSLLELESNMEQIWAINMDDILFAKSAQNCIKSFLSAIVLIRTFTLHLHITLSIAMLWPTMNGDRPAICFLWLLISGIKNIGTNFLAFLVGMFICATYGSYRPACIVFILSQMCSIIPSLYMWLVVRSFYRDLKTPKPVIKSLSHQIEEMETRLAIRRRKVRSMTPEDELKKQIENRKKYGGTSALALEELFKPMCCENMDKPSRSLDSLLDVMAAESEFRDVEESVEDLLEAGLSPSQKTMMLLGITNSQIELARKSRNIKKSASVLSERKQQTNQRLDSVSTSYDKPGPSGLKANKLLVQTSMYKAPPKVIRSTKSELRTPRNFSKLKAQSDYISTTPEIELRTESFQSLFSARQIIKDEDSSTDSEGSDELYIKDCKKYL